MKPQGGSLKNENKHCKTNTCHQTKCKISGDLVKGLPLEITRAGLIVLLDVFICIPLSFRTSTAKPDLRFEHFEQLPTINV